MDILGKSNQTYIYNTVSIAVMQRILSILHHQVMNHETNNESHVCDDTHLVHNAKNARGVAEIGSDETSRTLG